MLPRAAPWLAEFIREVASFPGDRHDDQADALAQMLANPPPTIEPPSLAGPVLYIEGEFQPDDYTDMDDIDDPWAPLE